MSKKSNDSIIGQFIASSIIRGIEETEDWFKCREKYNKARKRAAAKLDRDYKRAANRRAVDKLIKKLKSRSIDD